VKKNLDHGGSGKNDDCSEEAKSRQEQQNVNYEAGGETYGRKANCSSTIASAGPQIVSEKGYFSRTPIPLLIR
jgi:hypothetical protein